MTTCNSNYTQIYSENFFKTLGQLSAGVLSTTVLVPVYTYYTKGYFFYNNNKNCTGNGVGVEVELNEFDDYTSVKNFVYDQNTKNLKLYLSNGTIQGHFFINAKDNLNVKNVYTDTSGNLKLVMSDNSVIKKSVFHNNSITSSTSSAFSVSSTSSDCPTIEDVD